MKQSFKNLPLHHLSKPRATNLSTSLISENKNNSESCSKKMAERLARAVLGIPNAEITIVRVKKMNLSFREFYYKDILFVREQTFILDEKQYCDREIYPHISKTVIDLFEKSDKLPTSKEAKKPSLAQKLSNLILCLLN